MKRLSSLLAGVAVIAGAVFSLTSASPASAAPNTQAGLPLETVRAIQINAIAAHDNAGIYQWRRVNLEVDRIVAAEYLLEQTLPKEAAPVPAQILRQAVLDLRSARLGHDKNRTQAAAMHVSVQCTLLLR